MGMQLTGDWAKMKRMMAKLSLTSQAIDKTIEMEARYFRQKILQNIKTRGSWAGKPFKPNTRWTLAKKRGAKPLIDTGELLDSIQVKKSGRGDYYIGIDKKAVSQDGTKIYDIAEIQEAGKIIHIVVTHKMLAYLHAMARSKGLSSSGTGQALSVGSVLIVKIPPRPFIGPVYDKLYGNKRAAKRRVEQRLARILRLSR